MKVHVSFQVLRLMIPVARWALKNIEKKKSHSVQETGQIEALRRLLLVMKGD